MADNKFLDQQGLGVLWSQIGNIYARIRRDNESNYKKHGNELIPAKNEIVLIDTLQDGMRVKIGDGIKTYNQLDYADNQYVISGYYKDGSFYTDKTLVEELPATLNALYIDRWNHRLYYYDATEGYVGLEKTIPSASAEEAGLLKLYTQTGTNTDGTMTQKAITESLKKKIEASVNDAQETLILSIS